MDLLVLDKDFQMLGYLRYINLQWNRKYYEPGDFSVQVLVEDYYTDGRYLYTAERPEMGIIEKMHTDTDITGHYVQLSGRFLESMLSWNYISDEFSGSYRPLEAVSEIISDYHGDIPNFEIASGIDDGSGEAVQMEYFGKEVGETTAAILKAIEKAQRITYDFDRNKLVYSVWQGLDRTQEQSINNYAFFSDVALNVQKISVDEDDSGWANACLVCYHDVTKRDGSWEKDESAILKIEVDGRTEAGEPRRYKLLDMTGSSPSSEQSKNAWLAELRQKGVEELAKWQKVNNVQADTLQNGLFYLEDYDLGDKCDIVSNEIRRSYMSRIIEVHEVFKEGQHLIELVFGEKIPTLFERVKNR